MTVPSSAATRWCASLVPVPWETCGLPATPCWRDRRPSNLIQENALRVDPKAQGELRARFQREAHATARLRSPHTVELYDFGVSEDGSFFYVMECLTGIDLQRLDTRKAIVHG